MRLRFMRWRYLLFCSIFGCSAPIQKAHVDPVDPGTDDPGMDDAGDLPDVRVPLGDGGVPIGTSAVQILVEPDGQSGKQMVSAIYNAKKSVHMTMYLLSDSAVINALIARKKAGIDVKVVL